MSETNRASIKFTPAFINRVNVGDTIFASNEDEIKKRIALAQKFISHINAIKEWRDRKDSIRFLAENAKKLSNGFYIETENRDVLDSIRAMSNTESNVIDMKLLEECINIVISGMEQHALIALTGVMNK